METALLPFAGKSLADRLLGGAFDARPLVEARDALHLFWAEEWGKRVGQCSRQNMGTLRTMQREGKVASQVAMAIRGMRHDPWEQRGSFTDWVHVNRQMDRWIQAHIDAPVGPWLHPIDPARRRFLATMERMGLREWMGIWVPKDRPITSADWDRLKDGQRSVFVVAVGEWRDARLDHEGAVSAQFAKFGKGWNQAK